MMSPVFGSRAGYVLQHNCNKSNEFQGCVFPQQWEVQHLFPLGIGDLSQEV